MMKLVIDTNVIIRLLTGDDEQQSPVARELISKVESKELSFYIYTMVISECVYTLTKVYGVSKSDVRDILLQLIKANGVEVEEMDTVTLALNLFAEKNVSFGDALIASKAVTSGLSVVTWNIKDFKKLGCEFYSPEQLLNT